MPSTDNTVPMDQILCGDNLELIQQLPDGSIQLVITSPPYFQQRDYGSGMGNERMLTSTSRRYCVFSENVSVF